MVFDEKNYNPSKISPEEKMDAKKRLTDILIGKPENTGKLYETLMEDLAEEEIAEMKRKAKKEKLVDLIIKKLEERLKSPEHYQKTKENVMKAIQEAIAQTEKDGEEITRLKAAALKINTPKEQPIPKEYEGKILSGEDYEEETKIGYIPESNSENDYRKIANS